MARRGPSVILAGAVTLAALAACSGQRAASVAPSDTLTGTTAGGARDGADLQELSWIAPGVDALTVLLRSPGECLGAPQDEETVYLIEVGRAAFSSPLLFGGPAARSGLSCARCHRDGHGNSSFFLDGLSGDPGTADVTSSLFSKTRGDGKFNPAAIPSLVDAGKKKNFGTRAPVASLHGFIEGAVTDEFQGAPPPAAVIAGLVAYVAHLDSAACPAGPVARTAGREMDGVLRAMQAAGGAIERDDAATADFLIVSAQRALRPVYERYAGPALGRERKALAALAAELSAIRPLLPGELALAYERLRSAQAQHASLADLLFHTQSKSLYDKGVLGAALAGRNQSKSGLDHVREKPNR